MLPSEVKTERKKQRTRKSSKNGVARRGIKGPTQIQNGQDKKKVKEGTWPIVMGYVSDSSSLRFVSVSLRAVKFHIPTIRLRRAD